MDESIRFYSIGSERDNSTLTKHSFETINGNITKEFARHFSIDDDDDDVILLDQTEILFEQVKLVLNDLLQKIEKEHCSSQIVHIQNKRSLFDFNDTEEYIHNKKVRFFLSNDCQQQQQDDQSSSPSYLFVSTIFPSKNSLTPSIGFLSNLGLDLCLEQTSKQTNTLSDNDEQRLIQYNAIFHQSSRYSCKYCSFQTDTIHVMDYHYRTPHIYHHDRYRCTYCSFQTFRLSQLRRHLLRKHKLTLITEPSRRRYQCVYCTYETDERTQFFKHNKRCQIEQTRACRENNLLAPSDQANVPPARTMKSKLIAKSNNNNANQRIPTTTTKPQTNTEEVLELILIESDHDSSSFSRASSDDDFIVSSDEENTSNTDLESSTKNPDLTRAKSSKATSSSTLKPIKTIPPPSIPVVAPASTLPSLSKLLFLNGSSIPSYNSPSYNTNKSSLIPIQPKPSSANDVYQICNLCQCYIFKNDFVKHMNEKHSNCSAQPIPSTPILILNTPTNPIKPINSILPKDLPQTPTTIFLFSTNNTQLTTLNMIKCPWCDTNFEHIDIMTGHLMRYHRMTLAAAKVVVAEQMKIQGKSSTELSLLFKQEIEQIQNDFSDKTYWKLNQPKVYLHSLEHLSCFVCHTNVDNIENHFLTSHQIQLTTMNTIKQCCLCGFHCDAQNSSLFEHQLRTHAGVCYSSVLKQFIRFQPPPSSSLTLSKIQPQLPLSIRKGSLTTETDKKFGCRKCGGSSGLFTFEDLIEHLRSKHTLNVKLYRRCIICQETFLKGKEYNQHCLEHFNDGNPSVRIARRFRI